MQNWSKILHSFTKCRLHQTNLILCFDKAIDFLDTRNEVDLISYSTKWEIIRARRVPEQQDRGEKQGRVLLKDKAIVKGEAMVASQDQPLT